MAVARRPAKADISLALGSGQIMCSLHAEQHCLPRSSSCAMRSLARSAQAGLPGGLRGPLPRGRVTVRTTSATARCAARVGLGAARAGAERESLGSENAVGDSSDLLDDATNDGDSVARIT